MNKKMFLIIVGIIILIGLSIYIYCNNKENIVDVYDINKFKLERMSDSELANLFYEISKGDEFADENIKNYRFPYKGADSVEDAIEKTKTIGQSSDTKMLELKLQDETNYYYIIYQEYISYGGIEDATFKNSYLYFKNSILDINNKTIDTNVLDNANKVKEIFDLYTYIRNSDNGSIKLLLPEITENLNEYTYTYYYFSTSYGDWGLSDNINLYKSTISINKKSGNFESVENKIREVSGKYNEEPMLDLFN